MAAYVPPFPAYEEDSAFRDLAALMKSERPPLLLVGAGASVGSGYPAWNDLLRALREEALAGGTRDWRRSLDDLSDAPWTAELFASRLKRGGLGRLIQQLYRSRASLAEPHLTLARLPFPHYLTTNYDPSIEEALAQAGRPFRRIVWPSEGNGRDSADAEALSDFLIRLGTRREEAHVVYLHGRFDSPEDRIVLTERSYVARYIASDDARRKLMAIFMTHPVLFVGFSMNDPDLANLMREVTARLRTRTPCHYALMGYKGEVDREAIRARMVGKFGVRPVFFSRTPVTEGADEYSNLLLLLAALSGESRVAQRVHKKVEKAHLPATFDPDDPHKGRFGGQAAAAGRRVAVFRTGGSRDEGSLSFQLVVEALPDAPPLAGDVVFHLHPTFRNRVVSRKVVDGRATLSLSGYGAFTVGVEADGGATRLELDLAEEATLPLWFRRA